MREKKLAVALIVTGIVFIALPFAVSHFLVLLHGAWVASLWLCALLAWGIAFFMSRKSSFRWLSAILILATIVGVPVFSFIHLIRHPPGTSSNWMKCRYNLKEIGIAMIFYSGDYDGFMPYDDRGPLESLALLYPEYIEDPDIFVCPSGARNPKVRRRIARFPEGTSLAGKPCYYGYTWPDKPNQMLPLVADIDPIFHGGTSELAVMNVLYADGHIETYRIPKQTFQGDNIFAPNPGWSPDTDSYIRQRP